MPDREKLRDRVVPIELYKLTPRSNCGECGMKACLAFATQVVTGQMDLGACPYLDKEMLGCLRDRLTDQLRHSIGVAREGFEKTMDFLQGEVNGLDFSCIRDSIGANIEEVAGQNALILTYFDTEVLVTKSDIKAQGGGELSPWEKIFIYNYVIGGGTEPSGNWIGMESLPNSVSKIKSLRSHCEEPLARIFGGKIESLPLAIRGWGREIPLEHQGVDFTAEFPVFPKLTIRVLFWDQDRDEGYPGRVKFLFDSRVLHVLDLESLIFACEKISDRISQ